MLKETIHIELYGCSVMATCYRIYECLVILINGLSKLPVCNVFFILTITSRTTISSFIFGKPK